jgi:hypothetical protein
MSPRAPILEAPSDRRRSLERLIPSLTGLDVERLTVFAYMRPGEAAYWLAFLFIAGKRHSVGTPDLRGQSLDDQWPELLRQLESFKPTPDEDWRH